MPAIYHPHSGDLGQFWGSALMACGLVFVVAHAILCKPRNGPSNIFAMAGLLCLSLSLDLMWDYDKASDVVGVAGDLVLAVSVMLRRPAPRRPEDDLEALPEWANLYRMVRIGISVVAVLFMMGVGYAALQLGDNSDAVLRQARVEALAALPLLCALIYQAVRNLR